MFDQFEHFRREDVIPELTELFKAEPVILTNSHAVMNFVDRYFEGMKDKIDVYQSTQTVFGKATGADNALGIEKPVKTVNISKVKELGAEAKETGNVDYVWNARELYIIFLRTGGVAIHANHGKRAKEREPAVWPFTRIMENKQKSVNRRCGHSRVTWKISKRA